MVQGGWTHATSTDQAKPRSLLFALTQTQCILTFMESPPQVSHPRASLPQFGFPYPKLKAYGAVYQLPD